MRSNRHHTTSLCIRLENVSDVIDLRDFVRKNGQNLERKININPVWASSCNSENSSQETSINEGLFTLQTFFRLCPFLVPLLNVFFLLLSE